MEISVVIPTYNRINDIRGCLDALENQDLPDGQFEIIVVDNGSGDGTREFLKSQADSGKIRFLEEKKKGASSARNLGIMASNADFIAFTDDDCRPEPGWLSALLKSFPEDGKCAGIGGPVLTINRKNAIGRYCQHCRVWDQVKFGGKCLHITTMNSIYRRSALLDTGLFDERIIGVEDIHLSQKMIKKGYYLKYIDRGIVLHNDPQDLGTLYHRAWITGRGIALVGMLEGVRLKNDAATLLKRIIFPKRYSDRMTGKEKLPLYERIVFSIAHRVWNLGIHNGYSYEIKNSHL